MEFNWDSFEALEVTRDEVAESFEDPFSLRFLPDDGEIAERSRFFCLGKALSGKGVFSVYKSTGKMVTMLMAREMAEEEDFFYNRKSKDAL
ncbi:MAG: BrnT family toxin [Verrucomicrobiota bacterium]